MKHPKWGYALGSAWLFSIMVAGIYLLGISPAGNAPKYQGDKFPPLIPSSNPAVIADQLGTHRISKVARTLEEDYKRLRQDYKTLPAFHPPRDMHLTPADIEKYEKVWATSAAQFNYFKKKVVGKNPGVFRVFALVGMASGYYEVVKYRSLVKHRVTEEEFRWIRTRIMEAALFCVNYKLKHDKLSEHDRQQILFMRDRIGDVLNIKETDKAGKITYHWEKIALERIPRSNLELFLDNYRHINFTRIHFDRPIFITFDRAAILAAASNNPP